MNTNDLAELAAQKKKDQQIYQGYNPNEPCDDLKTPTAENQQSLMDNKVVNITRVQFDSFLVIFNLS